MIAMPGWNHPRSIWTVKREAAGGGVAKRKNLGDITLFPHLGVYLAPARNSHPIWRPLLRVEAEEADKESREAGGWWRNLMVNAKSLGLLFVDSCEVKETSKTGQRVWIG